MRKWIDINKQQPIEEQEYLCVCEDGCYWLGIWQPYDKEFAMIGTKHSKGSITVEWWQELPEQPSSEIIENDEQPEAEELCITQKAMVDSINNNLEIE